MWGWWSLLFWAVWALAWPLWSTFTRSRSRVWPPGHQGAWSREMLSASPVQIAVSTPPRGSHCTDTHASLLPSSIHLFCHKRGCNQWQCNITLWWILMDSDWTLTFRERAEPGYGGSCHCNCWSITPQWRYLGNVQPPGVIPALTCYCHQWQCHSETPIPFP